MTEINELWDVDRNKDDGGGDDINGLMSLRVEHRREIETVQVARDATVTDLKNILAPIFNIQPIHQKLYIAQKKDLFSGDDDDSAKLHDVLDQNRYIRLTNTEKGGGSKGRKPNIGTYEGREEEL
jgi:hypothetical protein